MFYNPDNSTILKSKNEIRRAVPNKSFPASIPDEVVLGEGYYYLEDELPDYNPASERVAKSGVIFDEKSGKYCQAYTVEPLPEDIVSKRLEAEKNAKKLEIRDDFQRVRSMASEALGAEVNFGEKHIANLSGLIKTLDAGETTEFRIFDNTFVTSTREQLELLEIEMLQNLHALYARKWELEGLVANALTISEIVEINW
ncbi:hypothetical protein [Limisalsivibrio acetivorans]|uniref:DUF4376 domain-containing protein n=1 Tax=Limisalsivibrio acetivorans TaxID=1304888 RepID=UPI0003FB691E|nr:hypothetical protein [Limisalsivibrio acetivorans]